MPRAGQEQPAAGTGSIAGTLTSADLGRPIRKAVVTLLGGPGGGGQTTISDAEGRYVFEALPGECTLSPAKIGYLEMTLGARRPGPRVAGTPLSLAACQQLDKIALTLPRASVSAGTVTDEFGDPAMGVTVRAVRFAYVNGHRLARPVGNAVTDDLGAYRIPGLMPGEHLVAAVPRDTVANVSATAESVRVPMQQVAAASQCRAAVSAHRGTATLCAWLRAVTSAARPLRPAPHRCASLAVNRQASRSTSAASIPAKVTDASIQLRGNKVTRTR